MNFFNFFSFSRSRIESTPECLDGIRDSIQAAIKGKEQYQRVLGATGDEAQQLLNVLQLLTKSPDTPPELRCSILKMVLRLSKRSGLCPDCLNINNVKKLGEHAIGSGRFGDVWKGKIDNHIVCLKMVKIYQESDLHKLLKDYIQEAIIWQQLRHPNLLPFMWIYYLDGDRKQLCLVSPWMSRGNLVKYLKDTPRERVNHELLAYDVASGLSHLHDMNVVHGDLKGANILVTPEERACITDFGLSRVADPHSFCLSGASTSGRIEGTMRWLAPELLGPPYTTSTSSDLYAYACVCYEIFTGRIPFHGVPEVAVIAALMIEKRLPALTEELRGLTGTMTQIMKSCWNHEASLRPTAREVLSRIGSLADRGGTPIQTRPASDWDDLLLSRVWKNVQYRQIETTLAVRFLRNIETDEDEDILTLIGDEKRCIEKSNSNLSREWPRLSHKSFREWVEADLDELQKQSTKYLQRKSLILDDIEPLGSNPGRPIGGGGFSVGDLD
ncbi:Rho guanine nucleotide exchange factor [Marasmius sp. AFHP31]|nr:Rho guanine nucleotide exchange factor [Marasmius sp. AFHP31]